MLNEEENEDAAFSSWLVLAVPVRRWGHFVPMSPAAIVSAPQGRDALPWFDLADFFFLFHFDVRTHLPSKLVQRAL
jgi:hypothetical protein